VILKNGNNFEHYQLYRSFYFNDWCSSTFGNFGNCKFSEPKHNKRFNRGFHSDGCNCKRSYYGFQYGKEQELSIKNNARRALSALSFLFLFLFLIPFSSAAQGPFNVGDEVFIYSNCVQDTGGARVFLDANQTLTVYTQNGTIYADNLSMTQYETGKFSQNITFNSSGEYSLIKQCNSSGLIAVGGDVAQVKNINEDVEKLALFGLMVLFSIGLLLWGMAYIFDSVVFHAIGVVWWWGNYSQADSIISGAPALGLTLLFILGIAQLFEAIQLSGEHKKEKRAAARLQT